MDAMFLWLPMGTVLQTSGHLVISTQFKWRWSLMMMVREIQLKGKAMSHLQHQERVIQPQGRVLLHLQARHPIQPQSPHLPRHSQANPLPSLQPLRHSCQPQYLELRRLLALQLRVVHMGWRDSPPFPFLPWLKDCRKLGKGLHLATRSPRRPNPCPRGTCYHFIKMWAGATNSYWNQ